MKAKVNPDSIHLTHTLHFLSAVNSLDYVISKRMNVSQLDRKGD